MSAIQIFTIVDMRTSKPFTLRVRQRPAVVAFRTYPNALLTARAIEARDGAAGTRAETYDLIPAEFSLDPPEHHFLQAWESYAALVESCRRDDSDVLYCSHIIAEPGESIEFTGHVQSTRSL
jgi:hypothetical protein